MSSPTPLLSVRIARARIATYHPPPTQITEHNVHELYLTLPPNPAAVGHLTALKGLFADFLIYATNGEGSPPAGSIEWLLRVTHLLFQPSDEEGELWTYKDGSGTYEYWEARDLDERFWHRISATDAIAPKIYEYRANGIVRISKISERHGRSRTAELLDQGGTFRDRLLRRDGSRCVITQYNRDLVASHLLPKRLGDAVCRDLCNIYCTEEDRDFEGIYAFSPEMGITLFYTIDRHVDSYDVGFYQLSSGWGRRFAAHCFAPATLECTYNGVPRLPASGDAPLHRYQLLPDANRPVNCDVPATPNGVFSWHYLQCVIKWLGTEELKSMDNIVHHPAPRYEEPRGNEDYGFQDPPPTLKFMFRKGCGIEYIARRQQLGKVAPYSS